MTKTEGLMDVRIIPCRFDCALHHPQFLAFTWKSNGQYSHCPKDEGMNTHSLVQTHDGHLAPVKVPTAWASTEGGEKGGKAWRRVLATGKVGTEGI